MKYMLSMQSYLGCFVCGIRILQGMGSSNRTVKLYGKLSDMRMPSAITNEFTELVRSSKWTRSENSTKLHDRSIVE